MFAAAIHFHTSLIFSGKARSLPFEWSPVRGSTLVGSSLASTRVDVNGSGKHFIHPSLERPPGIYTWIKHVLGTNFAERFFSDILTLIVKIILLKNVFDIIFLRTLVTKKLIKNS